MKRAIIYFSLTDNTKEAAERIGRELNADIYRIHMKRELPNSKSMQMLIGGMQSTFGIKPNIQGVPVGIEEYDEIILGTPIWASKQASPINTIIANDKIAERIKYAFTFSGGGDNDKCMLYLGKRLKNLKYSVALADRNNKIAAENMNKIQEFVGQIKNG